MVLLFLLSFTRQDVINQLDRLDPMWWCDFNRCEVTQLEEFMESTPLIPDNEKAFREMVQDLVARKGQTGQFSYESARNKTAMRGSCIHIVTVDDVEYRIEANVEAIEKQTADQVMGALGTPKAVTLS